MALRAPVLLPPGGSIDLQTLSEALRTSRRAVGSVPTAEIRTIRIIGEGRQYNWGTVLRAGIPADDRTPERVELAGGAIVLLRRSVRVAEFRSKRRLTSALASWPDLPRDEDGSWQDSFSVSRAAGSVRDGHLPYWYADLPRQGVSSYCPFRTPSEPFFGSAANFFAEDIPTAAAKWLRDPSGNSKWELKGTTRVILFDSRARFAEVESGTHEIRVGVASKVAEPIVCWAQTTDFSGARAEHPIDIVDGTGVLHLKDALQGFRLFLFVGWECVDRYYSNELGLFPFEARRSARPRFSPSQAALLEDAASGETTHVELKEWIPPTAEDTKYRELLKTVTAFANVDGGRLYIGVRDDGDICGANQHLKRIYQKDSQGEPSRAKDLYARKLRDNVREGIEPAIDVACTWIEHAGKSVLCVSIPAGPDKPYQVIDGRQYFIRKNGRSVLALPHEVEERILTRHPRLLRP